MSVRSDVQELERMVQVFLDRFVDEDDRLEAAEGISLLLMWATAQKSSAEALKELRAL